MKTRIYSKFQELKEQNKKALITFITAGDPSLEETCELVLTMEKAGADIIELGIPNSDPLADGPVIQESSQRALRNGTKIKNIFKTVKKIRATSQVPLVFLVYYNNVLQYKIDKFINDCVESGIDGLIIPDIPLEERQELNQKIKDKPVNLIPLVALTSKDRIKYVVEGAEGFVYCVSNLGVTGTGHAKVEALESFTAEVAKYTNVPRAIGFGISTGEDVRSVKDICDGVIVGSAVVKKVAEGRDRVYSFVEELKKNV